MSGEWTPALDGAAADWAQAVWRAGWQGSLAVVGAWGLCRLLSRLSPGERNFLALGF